MAALKELELLDSEAESSFDRITRLTASLLEVPIVLVSLVDEDRQWFKAKHGLQATETSRSISFCAHAIVSDEIFEVPDTHADKRFLDNPLVTDSPNIRFYAGQPIKAPGGERIGTLCVIDHRVRSLSESQRSQLKDLSCIIETELVMRAERNQARTISEIKTQFIAELSHELRTPANILLGSLQLLSDGDESTLNAGQALAMAMSAGQHIALMLNDLVDLNQIETKHFEANHSRFELGKLLEKLSALAQTECGKNDLIFRHKIQEGLPKALVGDEARINQILMNILNNAVRYTEAGEIQLVVSGHVPADSKILHLTIAVKDTGGGIGVDDIDHIFKPYYRSARAKEIETQGSGLGLALSSQIAKQMNGTITAESDGETGTTISFYVPLPCVPDQPLAESRASDSINTTPEELTDAKIMVVEDSSANRALLGAFLCDVSNLKMCEDGEGALNFATENQVDIILMDISLPGMDGVECAHRIRQLTLHADTKIIALTAHALKGDRDRFISAGFDDYLPKPFTRGSLMAKLMEYPKPT